jgi:nicotinate-nucleotide adenylyltransferase
MLAAVRSGLLGGTFDPPHIAHLLAGEVAYRQLGLDRVIFMPAGSPWQKANRRVSSATHRWEMTRRAVEEVAYFAADDREVHREGWTYTADTLATFDPNDEIVLILGADAARGLPTWERSAEVLARVELAVVSRPGVDQSSLQIPTDATWLDMPPLPISGTEIRGRFAAGRAARFLVAEPVFAYIVAHGLYSTANL